MPGTVAACKKFHLVVPGEGCWVIEQTEKISHADFMRWNTGVNADCTNLWANARVCVGI